MYLAYTRYQGTDPNKKSDLNESENKLYRLWAMAAIGTSKPDSEVLEFSSPWLSGVAASMAGDSVANLSNRLITRHKASRICDTSGGKYKLLVYERMRNNKSNQPMSDNENEFAAKTSELVTSILRSILLDT